MKKYNKGFTLIELLVVIAIIGIVSTIVLSAVSSSQAKGYDSKVVQQLTNFRTAAQIYFSSNGGSYGPDTIDCYGPTNTTLFNNFNAPYGSPGQTIATGVLPSGIELRCQANSKAYAIKASLYSSDNDYWCIDSTGASRKVHDEGGIGDPVTVCP